MKRFCKRHKLDKNRKATASLPSMITTTASSYKSCDFAGVENGGKVKYCRVLARILALNIGMVTDNASSSIKTANDYTWKPLQSLFWQRKSDFRLVSPIHDSQRLQRTEYI